MPRRYRKTTRKTSRKYGEDNNPTGLRTMRKNGEAPESRFRTAAQVFDISRQMVEDDVKRSEKRIRLYKAYKRFAPTEYSTLIELKMEGQSNVNWGMMAFIVDNHMTSFYDMIAERGRACDIQTKIGDPIEKRIYSDLISEAYDFWGIRKDYNYLLGQEVSLLDMLLYGKGIHIALEEGHGTEPCPAHEFFVPDGTRLSLDNFDLFMRKRKYELHELYAKIKDKDAAEAMGWNVEAVITAMRMQREEWLKDNRNEDFMHDIAEGNTSLSGVLKEHVHVYDMYCREFDGKISRFMVLQDYQAIQSLVNEKLKDGGEVDLNDTINKEGFLFCKMNYRENVRRVLNVFVDKAGSNIWHDTPSLAESIFVQCRQYDITMNSIMDAIKLNMTLLLQGSTAEATERLKAMVWGQFAIIPSDTPFVQQRTQLDTSSATQSIQFMMSDLYSGIGQYQVQQSTPSGEKPTATQRQLDAAESAKLTGTQVRRFNEQETMFHEERFRRFVNLKDGECGYEQLKEFKAELKENKVPDKAWKFENIRSIEANMIAGAGSASFRSMAAEKIIQLTNMTPKDDGQQAAIEDCIAAYATRRNVRRYIKAKERKDPGFEEQLMGLESESFSDPNLNPMNVRVFPNHNHVEHTQYHLNDMAMTVNRLEKLIETGKINEDVAFPGVTRLMHEGAHVGAHMKFLQRDEQKMPLLKDFVGTLTTLQKAVGNIQKNLEALQKQKKDNFDPEGDPDIMKQMALAQIQIDTAQKLAAIKIEGVARSHETKDQITIDKAATELAVTRAKGAKSPPKKPNGSR